MRTVKYRFEFSAFVTREFEVPDDAQDGDDAFEKALNEAQNRVDVNDYAELQDAYEVTEE